MKGKGEGKLPRKDVERFQEASVAVPAGHEEQVADGRDGDGGDD